MKVRKGFVSNSSSSSFVIAVDSEEDIKNLKITVEVDLTNYIDDYPSGILKTKEDVMKYAEENYLSEKDVKEMLDVIKRGKVVIAGSFASDSDDSVENYLCENGLNNVELIDGIEIINGEGGF